LPDEAPPGPSWGFLGDDTSALDDTLMIPPTLPDEAPPGPSWGFLGDDTSALDDTLMIPPTLPDEAPPGPSWGFLGDVSAATGAMSAQREADPGNTMIAHGWDLLGAALGAPETPNAPDSSVSPAPNPSSAQDLTEPDAGHTLINHGWDLLGAALAPEHSTQEVAPPAPSETDYRVAPDSSNQTLINQDWDLLAAALDGNTASVAEETAEAAVIDISAPPETARSGFSSDSSTAASQTLISHGWDLLGAALGGATAAESGEPSPVSTEASDDQAVEHFPEGGNTLISHGWDLLGAVLDTPVSPSVPVASDHLSQKPEPDTPAESELPTAEVTPEAVLESEAHDLPPETQV
jgi:hypothetical protein